ncbi:MAG: histidinol-phosphatase, partial [Coriobacteriia bacterium]|nr:histidinol-phosphatase [Coriobacteriia bacterium]
MDFFEFGAKWLRADFHLHTKADKEFQYSGVENDFVKDYISALVVKEIHVGVIANHNKFDSDEFKALSKAARAENICLLPGVELSVGDGTNGVHTIIVFSNEWLVGDNYIGRFLDQAFVNTPQEQYENGNANTQ